MSDYVVSNSTCLIGLERIQQLELLPQVFSLITIPDAVQSEVGLRANWLIVKAVKNRALVASLKAQVDDGEAEAIALAMELELDNNNGVLILDDGKARQLAKQLNLPVIGTVGVLLRAKQQEKLTEIKSVLDALLLNDFRISDALVKKALALAGE